MKSQNQIKRTLSTPEAIEYVLQLLEDEEDSFSRTELADFLCEEFEFQDPRGQNQQSGCLKALRDLEIWKPRAGSNSRRLRPPRAPSLRGGCRNPCRLRKQCRGKRAWFAD